MLSVSDVAEQIGVQDDIVLKWIANGELTAIDVCASKGKRARWRIRPADLEAFLLARQNAAPQPPTPRRKKPQAVTSNTGHTWF